MSSKVKMTQTKAPFDSSMGRLVLDEGKSRFISNSYYANLSDEVENIRGILHGDSDEDNEHDSPVSTPGSPTHHHAFVFDPHHMHSSEELHALHPSGSVFDEYWRIFEENVDPLTKMLHLPSTHQLIQSAKENPAACSKSNEALLFAIYFSTITSISAEECDTIVGESKSTLLHRYRWATELALARANFLITEEIVVLQALVLFMVGLRRYEDPRMLWSLTGLVVRIATTLGLHRDPTNFGLSPFDTEIRRRLWWQVCNADVRLSEVAMSSNFHVREASILTGCTKGSRF